MHAVGRIQADALAVRRGGIVHHLIHVRRAEILAGAAEFFHASFIADVGIVDDQVCGLVFFMLGAGVIEVGELVEGELAIALRRTDQVGFRAAIGGKSSQQASSSLWPGCEGTRLRRPPPKNCLKAGIKHARDQPLLESLMEVAHRPEFFLDPTGLNALLEFAESRF